MRGLSAIIARDVSLAFRAGGGAAQTVIFYALVILIFVLGVGPDPAVLSRVAAPVLWTAALLASLLSLDRMFQSDFEDGSLEMLVQRTPTPGLLVLAKALAHWLTTAGPLLLATPLLAIIAGIEPAAVPPLMLSLLVGTPALSLTGAIGAALTFPLRRANVLMTILIGPLFAPTVIFGVAAATPGADAAPMLFLGAATLSTVVIAPLAGGAAIRFNLQ
ncbi:MAG: heme exporter protein CcmB [Alphaproteobacteria bacterium]|nr:heme exporter protein CcmB [Alphaproteobacteria bacterium]